MRSCPLSHRGLDLKMLQAPLTGCPGVPHGHHTRRQHCSQCRPDRHPARRQCHTQVIQSACWLLCPSCTQYKTPPSFAGRLVCNVLSLKPILMLSVQTSCPSLQDEQLPLSLLLLHRLHPLQLHLHPLQLQKVRLCFPNTEALCSGVLLPRHPLIALQMCQRWRWSSEPAMLSIESSSMAPKRNSAHQLQ